MADRMDEIIEAIYEALAQPATTWAEVTERVNQAGVDVSQVNLQACVSHLRKNALVYRWTVPHIKRGIPNIPDPDSNDDDDNAGRLKSDEGRIRAVLVESDGSYIVDSDPALLVHLQRGEVSDLTTWHTQIKNLHAALNCVAAHTRKRSLKARFEEVGETLEFVGRRVKRLLKQIQDEAA